MSEWMSEWMSERMNQWINEIEFCWRIKRMSDQFPLLTSVLVAAGIRQESDKIFVTIFWVSWFFIFDALAQFWCNIRHPGSVQKSWKKFTQEGFRTGLRKGLRKGHRKLPGKVPGKVSGKIPGKILGNIPRLLLGLLAGIIFFKARIQAPGPEHRLNTCVSPSSIDSWSNRLDWIANRQGKANLKVAPRESSRPWGVWGSGGP